MSRRQNRPYRRHRSHVTENKPKNGEKCKQKISILKMSEDLVVAAACSLIIAAAIAVSKRRRKRRSCWVRVWNMDSVGWRTAALAIERQKHLPNGYVDYEGTVRIINHKTRQKIAKITEQSQFLAPIWSILSISTKSTESKSILPAKSAECCEIINRWKSQHGRLSSLARHDSYYISRIRNVQVFRDNIKPHSSM